MKDCRIVLVDDEEVILDSVRDYFDQYTIITHSDPRAALEYMRGSRSDVLICDYRMPHLSGLDVLREAKKLDAYGYGILLTAYADKDLLLYAIQEDLVDRVVEKPLSMETLESTLRDAVASFRREELRRIELAEVQELYRKSMKGGTALCGDVIGLDGGLSEAYAAMKLAAGTRETILITGETGTGKEVAARLIHSLSRYGSGPFVKINCGAIPETLMESELFGHVKGAFSGADADRVGKIEAADGGTLFLDEIGELTDIMQTRFLQVLQDRSVVRVGSNRAREVDFRLVSATNRDLDADVESGRFRKDLFFRVNTIRVRMPPLRARSADIAALSRSILDSFCAETGRPKLHLSREALGLLEGHSWPGNVRELENELKRAVIFCDPRQSALPAALFGHLKAAGNASGLPVGAGAEASLDELIGRLGDGVLECKTPLEGIERKLLTYLLEVHGGNVLETARKTGIAKDRFYRHLAREGKSAKGRAARNRPASD